MLLDIYFEPEYGKLYEKVENGKHEIFDFEHEYGRVYHSFIKREIESKLSNESWYDLITPYGYGGPVILDCIEGKEAQLVRYFKEDFADYCKKNNIVSEFVRFHPLVRNAKKFKGMYEVKYSRKTVGTNLKKYDDPFQEEFSRSCRKNVRRALREGVSYQVTAAPDNIDSFKEIYYQTMDRNNANEYYYFDEQYFSQCLKHFKSNLLIVEAIYDDKTIAMGFYFIYGKTIHIHLSGTLNEYLYLSPAYILRYAVTQWGKENSYDLIHHGGGRSGRANDSLYLFKKQFGANTSFKFYLGKKIWNTGMYEKLCLERRVDANIEFFPAYRERI